MATCEFHGKYEEFLTGHVAVELIGKEGLDHRELGTVFGVAKRIAICKDLEQITPAEAENLTSIVYKLYPQYEEEIRKELNQQFG
jgi:hypothetical protein